jgi:hypothetical protein
MHIQRLHIQRQVGRLRFQHRLFAREEFGRNGGRLFGNNFVGPFGLAWPFFYGLPGDFYSGGTETPAGPEVVVLSTPPSIAPPIPTPQAPLDFSYVAGCHPIPNGYHCDSQHQQTSPQ